MRRCQEGLQDLQRAKAVISGKVTKNSLELIALHGVEGAEQIRSGAFEQAEQTFHDDLSLLDTAH